MVSKINERVTDFDFYIEQSGAPNSVTRVIASREAEGLYHPNQTKQIEYGRWSRRGVVRMNWNQPHLVLVVIGHWYGPTYQ